jgi:predicted glycoside hydrolase/deacetylase ChbG (UPF0249 family)
LVKSILYKQIVQHFKEKIIRIIENLKIKKMNLKLYQKTWLIASFIIFIQSLSFAQEPIKLLMRADDMGKTYGRTLGIIKAHNEGIINSASIMPTSAYFEESVTLCKENPSLAVGIHITIADNTQRPVLSPELIPSIVSSNGFFYENSSHLEKLNPKIEDIEKEIRAQIGKVRATGLQFVYLDWHRSVSPEVQNLILKICKDEKLIYGQARNGLMYGYKWTSLVPESWPKQEMPDGQIVYYAAPAFSAEKKQSFFDAINNLAPGKYIAAVHPGLAEPQRISMTELLCSSKLKEIMKRRNIQLVSYHDLWKEEFAKIK